MTRFSIIIPMYNAEAYVRKCVESALRQDAEEYEIILINDGSTDRTAELCREYLSNPRIVYYAQRNMGVSAARNRGLASARGEYVVFLDADDYLTENCLTRIYDFMKRQDLDVTTFNYKRYREDGTLYDERRPLYIQPGECWDGKSYIEKFGFRTEVVAWNFVYRRMFLEEHSFRFAEGLFHEDCEWTAHWFPYVKRYGYLNQCVYHQMLSPYSIMRSKNKKKAFDLVEISTLIRRDAKEIVPVSEKCAKELRRYASFEAWSAVRSCCAMGFPLSDLLTSGEMRTQVAELMKDNWKYVVIRWLLLAKMDAVVEMLVKAWRRLKRDASTL